MANAINLLSNAAAGTSAAQYFPGGRAVFVAQATWGGGNVKLQCQAPGQNWFDVASSTLSADGMLPLDLPPGQYRAVAATGSAFYASLVSVPYGI
jgi:hypothetical protein